MLDFQASQHRSVSAYIFFAVAIVAAFIVLWWLRDALLLGEPERGWSRLAAVAAGPVDFNVDIGLLVALGAWLIGLRAPLALGLLAGLRFSRLCQERELKASFARRYKIGNFLHLQGFF